MMRTERLASVGAALSALSALACCLPLGIPAALGLVGLSVVLTRLQPWLIGFALMLLAAGIIAMYRGRSCQRRSRLSLMLLGVSAVIVLAVTMFPQVIADLLARL
jgi:uncharacterized membrane protein